MKYNRLSFLSVLAAKRLGIKTIIHEQNIVPGRANILSSLFVDDVVTSFDNTSIELSFKVYIPLMVQRYVDDTDAQTISVPYSL